ncbi:glutamine--fructose-6-phosphate transaminase (isomerizing) [Amycolatopsis sp. K13G38]|uniref:Glutamine--fructose-6-phosphate aminotransferase [isomerizing] n=1 Tax=Amycolatopsis acididurans TaxID=2724524 RepID=A0ABX1IYF5_9PSEU|nr:glutamine--fructose-6-phosphate transaminase (isomerizing) [Amycolatopsis acididurans]NKQ52532.1 glutamine--fructose-6-phosphate transaminase (isomerizing) [Amycolatopsis acididurans]
MCGIVAYHGSEPALPAVLDALARLEYRGYDSTGVALNAGSGPVRVFRSLGRLPELAAKLPAHDVDAHGGIAHTRWATHGEPSESNAHPHRDCTGRIALVHNGTLDNASALRAELVAAGHVIKTEVDSELIGHLIEDEFALLDGPLWADLLAEATASAVRRLSGSWALAITVEGFDGIVLARHRSPLLVGEAPGARMAASDQLGFDASVATVRELADGDIVVLSERLAWFDHTGEAAPLPEKWRITTRRSAATLDGSADFTAKEIGEQAAGARTLVDSLAPSIHNGQLLRELGVPAASRVRLVACGSSAYAAQAIANTLACAGIPAHTVTASEHALAVAEPGTLTMAISQSGETADVLTALEAWRDPVLAITNNAQSTLARGADAVLGLGCGPEIGVAATKSFTAQVIAGAAVALSLAAAHQRLDAGRLGDFERLLRGIPDRLAATSREAAAPAAAVGAELAAEPGWIFVSRGTGVPFALEGALKLKELSYRWTEALPAGELKHGPIALIQPGTPVVLVQAEPVARLAVNAREMAARGARIITVGRGEDAVLPVALPGEQAPWGPVESVVALQHLARETARHLGHDVDRPRNLAKSVTVE